MENKAWIIAGGSVVCLAAALLMFDVFTAKQSDHLSTPSSEDHQDHHSHLHQDTVHEHHAFEDSSDTKQLANMLISPLPSAIKVDKNKAKLGWLLFRDPNLSSNGKVSCETCHSLQSDGAEEIPVSVGVGGQGVRNSLTVFNVAYNYRFFGMEEKIG